MGWGGGLSSPGDIEGLAGNDWHHLGKAHEVGEKTQPQTLGAPTVTGW